MRDISFVYHVGKRLYRKPDTQTLGDYGIEEWRDGGKIGIYIHIVYL